MPFDPSRGTIFTDEVKKSEFWLKFCQKWKIDRYLVFLKVCFLSKIDIIKNLLEASKTPHSFIETFLSLFLCREKI